MRDVKKRAEEGRELIRKHPRTDLNLSEIEELYKIFRDKESRHGGIIGVINTAFDFGVSVGSRLK